MAKNNDFGKDLSGCFTKYMAHKFVNRFSSLYSGRESFLRFTFVKGINMGTSF